MQDNYWRGMTLASLQCGTTSGVTCRSCLEPPFTIGTKVPAFPDHPVEPLKERSCDVREILTMKRRILISVLGLFALWAAPAWSQSDMVSASVRMDSALAILERIPVGSPSNQYDEVLRLLDSEIETDSANGTALHYKGYALFRKSSALSQDRKQKTQFKAVLQEADRVLERASQHNRWPETAALRSAVVGQLISVSGLLSIPRLGPRSNNLMEEAVEQGQSNPRVWLLKGMTAIHKPKAFGGGLSNAESDLRKSIELFEAAEPATAPKPHWGHAEAWAWLGLVQMEQKKLDEARVSFEKALELDPDLIWVTRDLFPQLADKAR